MNTEYALILGLVTLGSLTTLQSLGDGVSDQSDALTESFSRIEEESAENATRNLLDEAEDSLEDSDVEVASDSAQGTEEELAITPVRIVPRGGNEWSAVAKKIASLSSLPLDQGWAQEARRKALESYEKTHTFASQALQDARDYTRGWQQHLLAEAQRAKRHEVEAAVWKERLEGVEKGSKEYKALNRERVRWHNQSVQEKRTLNRALKRWKREQTQIRNKLKIAWRTYERKERQNARDFQKAWLSWRRQELSKLRT